MKNINLSQTIHYNLYELVHELTNQITLSLSLFMLTSFIRRTETNIFRVGSCIVCERFGLIR